jgi:hypothetical protein
MNLPRTIVEYISRSTMKREIATALLVWWCGLGTGLMLRTPVSQYTPDAALSTWSGMGVLIVGFAAAAFGTDWISKQTTIAGPPINTEIKTETVVTEDTAITKTTATDTTQ